jgi:predicted nucleotidyltransferase
MTLLEQIRQADLPMLASALENIVRQIVDAVQPDGIILFGSAARGAMKPGSDLDLLVIKSGDYHHVEMAQRIYMALGKRDFAVDITVATPEEVERYRDEHCLVLHPALRDGKVIYDARAA